MANVKISELPVATSLSNGDSFPVVQGGVTKQAARSVLFASPTFTGTAAADLLTATGDVTFDGGAFVFNESGADKDARFEGDTDANLLFLDASTDRVGVGTSTPAAKLDVNGAAIVRGFLTQTDAIKFSGNTSAPSATDAFVYRPADNTLAFGTASSERMRLDSSGNLGLGVSNPAYLIDAIASGSGDTTFRLTKNGSINATINAVTGALTFGIDGSGGATERARITSAGDFLVGSTGEGLQNSYSTNFAQAPGYWTVNHANGSPDTRRYFYFGYNGTEIGSITQNGTTAVAYNTTSDRRLKDNIVPAPSASDVIDAIEIVSHDWKSAPDEHVTYGVIAQDLHAVVPQAVSVGDDGETVGNVWGVDYSKLVPMLIKEIQSLRARVAALEAK